MTSRGLSFGAAASAYEQHRPGYPQELVDLVLAYGRERREIRTALEIGAGTGKATRAFAGAGVVVTATEPDAAMLAELRRQVPEVETIHAPFEDVAVMRRFDLVFAAAALHWTSPEGRWERVAALLAPGGTFASFGGPVEIADARLRERVEQARARYVIDDDIPAPDGTDETSPMRWPGSELEASPLFTDVRQEHLARRLTLSADDYLAHLATISAYLQLAPAIRTAAFAAMGEALPGQVELSADLTVHLARLGAPTEPFE
ncbi:class I SAM-dependent methyltransferase [Nocardioides sp. GXZ039]|uniref:class I SAM-dependent methyltransferase n=1 Tax=Nocardioides sp. GXZ039 TaxID=3136018 RepID=UPI0030F431B4